jgi:hypothetical protein
VPRVIDSCHSSGARLASSVFPAGNIVLEADDCMKETHRVGRDDQEYYLTVGSSASTAYLTAWMALFSRNNDFIGFSSRKYLFNFKACIKHGEKIIL